MTLAKAHISVLDADAVGPELPAQFDVQFNPTEYTINKGAQIAEIAIYGIDSPILQFVRGQNERLTMDLYFDTTAGVTGTEITVDNNTAPVDVTTLTRRFYQLVKIQSKTHAPPRIRFTWGERLAFKAIVESVQQRFTLFSPAGIPLRATLSVTFREYRTLDEQLKDLNLQSVDFSKQYVVKRGDTLARIAAREYGDARAWRPIADANPLLSSVRDLVPGTTLLVPPLDAFGNPVVA